jgi:acetylornithine/N-succinyldiaminopimelate aminotransferase
MQYHAASTDSLMFITNRPDLVFERGEGSWLYDHNGKAYLDFIQGWAVNTLGHCPPEIAAALVAQAGKLINPSPAFYNGPMIELAGLLTANSVFDRVFFANTGAEANEGAIKLARKWGQVNRAGAFEIITFADAFHGRTLATMSASGKAGWDTLFEPKVPGFPKARLNDLDSVQALLSERTVAVMLEPVQGEAGVLPADAGFVRALRALCDTHGLLLILDEVQTGIGRTGTLFASEQAGVLPDILTLGKGLGGGVPLAALLARESVAAAFAHGDQGGTYCGNPLMAAVGSAVLDVVAQPSFLAVVRERAAQLQGVLQAAAQRIGGSERGAGLLRALVLPQPVGPQLVDAARNLPGAGLLINAPRPNVIRLMPALNVTAQEIDQFAQRLNAALEEVL